MYCHQSGKYMAASMSIMTNTVSFSQSVCFPSLQSFLSLANLLSSSQSVWELLGRQPLASKSKYTLREMPTSIPVSAPPSPPTHTHCSSFFSHMRACLHFTFGLPNTTHTFVLLQTHSNKAPPHRGRYTLSTLHIVNFHSVFILHYNCCIRAHGLSFHSTGFDWQADCCEFRCEDSFSLPLWTDSHIRPEVGLIFFFILLNISGEAHDIGLAPGDCTHTSASGNMRLAWFFILWLPSIERLMKGFLWIREK